MGSRLKRQLERNGWRVAAWTRQPEPGSGDVAYRLGQEVDPNSLKGARALVHCAYDYGPRSWEEIAAINVAGSQIILAAAREAGVGCVVFISSISAFAGCRSFYGKAKMAIESFAQSNGAHVIRPGLVYSDNPGAMFGHLLRQVRGSRFVPIVSGGEDPLAGRIGRGHIAASRVGALGEKGNGVIGVKHCHNAFVVPGHG